MYSGHQTHFGEFVLRSIGFVAKSCNACCRDANRQTTQRVTREIQAFVIMISDQHHTWDEKWRSCFSLSILAFNWWEQFVARFMFLQHGLGSRMAILSVISVVLCLALDLLSFSSFQSVNHRLFAFALQDGLALRPPMGWRSWNLYGTNVDQELIIKIMEGMVKKRGPQQVSLCDLGL